MHITEVKILPWHRSGMLKAMAEVVIDNSLTLRGIRVIKTRTGYIVEVSGNRVWSKIDEVTMKSVQERVLSAYIIFLAGHESGEVLAPFPAASGR